MVPFRRITWLPSVSTLLLVLQLSSGQLQVIDLSVGEFSIVCEAGSYCVMDALFTGTEYGPIDAIKPTNRFQPADAFHFIESSSYLNGVECRNDNGCNATCSTSCSC